MVTLVEDVTDAESAVVAVSAPISSLAAAVCPGLDARPRPRLPLTGREHEILSLIARGLSGKQVARHLGISPKTIEHHKTRIFAKLGVPNQTAACIALARLESAGDESPDRGIPRRRAQPHSPSNTVLMKSLIGPG